MARAEKSDIDRKFFVDNLQDGHALITLDYAMKFLPQKSRERSKDWFGKRGISYHISHVLAKLEDGNEIKQHTFVHVFGHDRQV